MNMQNIYDGWGAVVEFNSAVDFFKQKNDFWRNKLYEKKLIVFKKMKFSKEDYAKFSWYFGQPWESKDYKLSYEQAETVVVDGKNLVISPISNLISAKLGLNMMPWHSDIPLSKTHRFPIRSLWMVSNPNPDSGLTSWLNVEDGLARLSDKLFNQLDDIKIVHQSWYDKTEESELFNFVKTHPITGNHSLRLNFFCDKTRNRNDAWIKKVTLKGEIKEPGDILKPYYRELTSHPDLVYTHKWDDFDIVIFDNWSFVHSRTKLKFDPTLERKFYRTNIKHLANTEWNLQLLNNTDKYQNGQ